MSYHIVIKPGNLLDESAADYIVNPSNTILSLGTGVSGAFSSACGPALQEAMTQALHSSGSIEQGDVVATPPGDCSRFRFVLHAAVMDYRPEARQVAPTLNTVRTILTKIEAVLADEAEKTNSPLTLVLPMMGTGVGGLDKEEVLKIYRDFFSRPVAFECSVTLYLHSERDFLLAKSVYSGDSPS